MVNTELLLTDGDGTLSEAANPFLTVAEVLGCGKAVRELVKSYLRKEMSYDELVEVENSLFLERGSRYANRLGMPRLGQHEFRKLFGELGSRGPAKGIASVVQGLQARGVQVVIISSGWDFIISRLAETLRVTEWHANKVRFVNGEFAGTEVIVTGEKIETCESVLGLRKTPHERTAYWGDNAFDFPIMEHLHDRGGRIFTMKASLDISEYAFPVGTEILSSTDELTRLLCSGSETETESERR